MINLVVISFITFFLGYFIGYVLCHRNNERRRSGYLKYEIPANRKVRVIDKITGKIKYEGTVSQNSARCDATRINLNDGSSRIYYWRDDTEYIEYID